MIRFEYFFFIFESKTKYSLSIYFRSYGRLLKYRSYSFATVLMDARRCLCVGGSRDTVMEVITIGTS